MTLARFRDMMRVVYAERGIPEPTEDEMWLAWNEFLMERDQAQPQ